MKFDISTKIFLRRVNSSCLLSSNKFTKCVNFLIINNYSFVEQVEQSDLVLFDLCGVFENYVTDAEKSIAEYLSMGKKIILIGCISPSIKSKYESKDIIFIDSKQIQDIENYFDFNVSFKKIESFNFKDKLTIFETDEYLSEGNTEGINKKTAFISISDGCAFNCSYCNIKKIKGDPKSVGIDNLLEEIGVEIDKGKDNLYLLSDDCGSYGLDIGQTLVDLLSAIFEKYPNIKVSMTNIHPTFVIKYYDEIKRYFFENKIIYLEIPLQHTSNKILKLMKRNYDIGKIIEILKELKEKSKVIIWNNMIFDYHEETLEEFTKTFTLLNYYDKTIYIKYSDINKTYGGNFQSLNLKDKLILLKKMQLKYNIDIVF